MAAPPVFNGEITTSSTDIHPYRDIDGDYTILYPESAQEVAVAINHLSVNNRTFLTRSGTSYTTQNRVNAPGACVLNLTALDRVTVDVDGVTVSVESGATTEQLADELWEHNLFLPLQPIPGKTIVSAVLSNDSGYFKRCIAPLRTFLIKVEFVCGTEGVSSTTAIDDALDRVHNEHAAITKMVFKALSEPETSQFWMARVMMPYHNKVIFRGLLDRVFPAPGDLSNTIDVNIETKTSSLGFPAVFLNVTGKSETPDVDANSVLSKILGFPEQSISVTPYKGKEIIQILSESAELGGVTFGHKSSKHSIVLEALQFADFADGFCDAIELALGTNENGVEKLPNVSISSRIALAANNRIDISAIFLDPDDEDEAVANALTEFTNICPGAAPEVVPGAVQFIAAELPIETFLYLGRPPRIDNFSGEIYMHGDRLYKKMAKQYATSSYPEADMSPYMVAYPETVDDIRAAVLHAKKKSKKIVVRSGGHQYCGLSSGGKDTIVLSMERFSYIAPVENAPADTARFTVGVGTRLMLIAKEFKKQEVTIPHGECPLVGIGGHCQTGGYGHILRSFGLALDYVYSFKIMKEDGTVITITRPTMTRNADNDDMFFAVLGGGPGSFGVLIEVTFEVIRDIDHPNSGGLQARFLYSQLKFRELMNIIREWTEEIGKVGSPASSWLLEDMDLMATASSSFELANLGLFKSPPPLQEPPAEGSFIATSSLGFIDDIKSFFLPKLLLECVYGNKDGANGDSSSAAFQKFEDMFNRINAHAQSNADEGKKFFESGNRNLSFLSNAFVRGLGMTADGREYQYPYEKRLNGTFVPLSQEFVNEFVNLVEDSINDDDVKIVFQLTLGGGAHRKNIRRDLTSCSRRDITIAIVYDVFYKAGRKYSPEQENQNKEKAIAYQTRMGTILDQHFPEGQSVRQIWGSYGDVDINNVSQYYYDNHPELYEKLRTIKKRFDPTDIFHTRFTVQL